MTALNKQALRQTAEKAQEHGVFNMDIHSETVLALLDEMEAADRRNAELNSTLERWATDRAQSTSELDDAEKRIAELEARTVTLPPKEHDNGTDSQIDINAGFANRMWQKCYDAIRAAGIGVKWE
ncbi:MAG: ead/Ea22-like family protein [Citrobacter freundii]|jgi:chromosome segregation ATPase|nr:ead/Ea22-like family protein [Citrobacter freundii]MCI1828460.1 ead/Ea22-like family protein [Citrobacter freundii]